MSQCISSWCNHGTLYVGLHRNDKFTAKNFLCYCQSCPISLRAGSTRGIVCVSASLAIVPLDCAGPRRQRWQATVCDRPSHPAMITFSSLPPSPLPLVFTLQRASAPPPLVEVADIFDCQSANSKTSKQMRSSPVQHCRPAGHASSQETPRTCWLCTFPERQRRM